jgi:hypothetical protein
MAEYLKQKPYRQRITVIKLPIQSHTFGKVPNYIIRLNPPNENSQTFIVYTDGEIRRIA